MIKPLLQDAYDPVSERLLAQFESQIGSRLPEDYRFFLFQQNGGSFGKDVVFPFTTPDGLYSALGLNELYGFGYKTFGLEDTYKRIDTYLPKGFVPVGEAACGDQVCIVVAGEDVGSIWLWDHEAGISNKWPPDNSKRVASNFQEFIDGIIFDPEAEDQWYETIPAFQAAEQGDVDSLARLLDDGFDVESRNDRGQTLLICAADNRQSQIVRLLLDRGANVNARDNQDWTALNRAAASSSLDSAKLLIAAGADLEATDHEGNTPLLKAVPNRQRLALYLIEQGADVNAVNNSGYRPLQYCTGYGTDDLRAALIRAGADESLAKEPVPRTQLELCDEIDVDDID
jgi:hypothetical protein